MSKRDALRCRMVGFTMVWVLTVGLSTTFAQQITQTFTTDADFDQGMLMNVNHGVPNTDQLQLNDVILASFPFINVAASARGTVVRIDVNTGEVLGEYRSAPLGMGTNPSRTTVDLCGNVWCGNRDEVSSGQGSVVKIGLVIGGTRVDANGVPDATGEYLAPPFDYNTCIDRDGDGLIKTSMGLGDIRSWTSGLDPDDECILLYVRTPGVNVRHVSVDANNDVWVAGYPFSPTVFTHLDGDTGASIGTFAPPGCGGYGGFIDGNGILWSASISQNCLLRFDIAAGTGTSIPVGSSYGLGGDNAGNIWNARFSQNTITKLDASGNLIFTVPTGGNSSRGVAITPSDDNVWVANSGSATVTRLAPDGTLRTTIPVGVTPTGVAVDSNGLVWVANLSSSDVRRIDPNGGGNGLGAVDMTVNLNSGGLANAGPYNYSDMTGSVVGGLTSPMGSWCTVYDGGQDDIDWNSISWNALVPAASGFGVKVRSSNDVLQLPALDFIDVGNATDPPVAGRYIEICVDMARSPDGMTPVLFDLTIQGAPPECFLIASPIPNFEVVSGHGDVVLVHLDGPKWAVTLDSVPSFTIPDHPALIGRRVYFQVAMWNPVFDPADPLKLSNGLEVTLGGGALPFGPSSGMSLWLTGSSALGGTMTPAFSIAGL